MSQFIQLHLITAYPPSNMNRDDLGRPKTAQLGGTERLRLSSQSLKRAWRTSEIFEEALGEFTGTRTKLLGVEAYNEMTAAGADEKKAFKWAKQIAGIFGKSKGANKEKPLEELEIEQLVHVSPSERAGVLELSRLLAKENRDPKAEELKLLKQEIKAVDIAMFGRMLANSPGNNQEAAVQVSHAISVNQVVVEDDFFTAVDDLNTGEEDAGSSHLGDREFGAGVFYTYICINRDLLVKNLSGDEALANKALQALLTCAVQVAPGGMQNSFASRGRASYALAEKGSQQPRSLITAFIDPVKKSDQIAEAVSRLESYRTKMNNAYGACYDSDEYFYVEKEHKGLKDLLKFVTE